MSLANSEFEEVGFDDGLQVAEETPMAPDTPPGPIAPEYRKQDFSIYTVLLILSFVFLLISVILLFLEVDRFGS